MLNRIIASTIFVAALIPAVASAQTNPDCVQQKHGNEVVGALVGGGLGALLGNSLGHGGGREGGTIIGGVGGAAVGATVAAGATHCGENQYGYYDQNGQWVPRTVNANGYYGPNGQWIDGPPPGYGQGPPGDFGPGGPPPPAYGDQPGAGYGPPAGGRGQRDTRDREARLESRINEAMANGVLGPDDGRRDMRRLQDIRRMDADYRNGDGQLAPDQYRDIDQRLDALSRELPGNGAPQRPY
jgi:hypothetical protein